MTTTDLERPTAVSNTDTQTNKAIAYAAQHGLLVDKDFDSIARYYAVDYHQHNPALRNGRADFEFYKRANVPLATTEILFHFGDRDLVFLAESVTELGPVPLCFFDIYRLDEGTIVEHWDAFVPVEGPNPSGRTMFEYTKDVGDPTATEATRTVVTRLINDVFVLDHPDRLDLYVAEDVKQFTPGVDDGVKALAAHFRQQQWFGGHVDYRAIRKVIAEGQVALVASEAFIGEEPYVIFDLLRVQDGKVVEYTSLRQRVEKSPHHNNPRI